MSDTNVARVGRRIAPGQMFITLMVAVALAAVLVSSAAGRARVPESPVVFNLATAQADGFVYVPLTPNRILDTRFNLGLTGPLQSKTPRTFQVTGLHPADVNTQRPRRRCRRHRQPDGRQADGPRTSSRSLRRRRPTRRRRR